MTQTLYEFGEFEIDCARFELRRNGRVVKAEHIPMELLILLAERMAVSSPAKETTTRVHRLVKRANVAPNRARSQPFRAWCRL